jgi:hypothetical protein
MGFWQVYDCPPGTPDLLGRLMNMKTFKIIIDYTAEGEDKEELKKRIISHMTEQSLDMEMSIPNIKIEEINNNAC